MLLGNKPYSIDPGASMVLAGGSPVEMSWRGVGLLASGGCRGDREVLDCIAATSGSPLLTVARLDGGLAYGDMTTCVLAVHLIDSRNILGMRHDELLMSWSTSPHWA